MLRDVRRGERRPVPNVLAQFFPGYDAPVVADQMSQEIEHLRSENDRSVAVEKQTPFEIDADVAEFEHAVCLIRRRRARFFCKC